MTCCFSSFKFIRNFFTPSETRAAPGGHRQEKIYPLQRSRRADAHRSGCQKNGAHFSAVKSNLSNPFFTVLLLLTGSFVSSPLFADSTEVRIYYIFQGAAGIERYNTPQAHYAAVQAFKKQAEANAATKTKFLDLFPVPSGGTINGQYKGWQYHYQTITNGILNPTILTNGAASISVDMRQNISNARQ